MKKHTNERRPKIVVIGGGTGTYTVLSGLKDLNVDITAVVTMADSGGVAKVERDEFGILPNSDIRKAILALTSKDSPDTLNKLFSYRFYQGVGISGYTFGNFFLAALTDILDSQIKAIEYASKILECKGKVLPVSIDKTNLVATLEDESQILGETNIDNPNHDGQKRIKNLTLIPKAEIYPETKKAISQADIIVIGPGDLFTSIIANLIVGGVKKSIAQSKAKKVYIVNLIAKYGETYRYSALDHVKEVEKYLGKNVLNYVLINKNGLPKRVINNYRKERGYPVIDDLKNGCYKIIRKDLLAKGVVKGNKDKLKRSLVRHDSKKLAKTLIKLI